MRWLDARRLDSTDPTTRWKGALSLARAGDPLGLQFLIDALPDESVLARLHRAETFSILTNAVRTEVLEPAVRVLLGSDEGPTRAAAAGAVAALGNRQLASTILRRFDELRHEVETSAQSAGSIWLPPVESWVPYRHWSLRLAIASLLDRLGPEERSLALVLLGRVREAAKIGLAARSALLRALDAGNYEAATQLEGMSAFSPTPEQKMKLLVVIGEYEPKRYIQVATEFGAVSVPYLLDAAEQRHASKSCMELGGSLARPELKAVSVPGLIRILSRRHSVTAVYALSHCADSRAIDVLVKCLGSTCTDPRDERRLDVAEAAAKALGNIMDRRAVVPLIEVLNHDNSEFVAEAALALGRIGDRRAVEPLIAQIGKRPDPTSESDCIVCRSCCEALGSIGDQRAANCIIALLKIEHGDPLMQIRACEAIAKLADPRAISVLDALAERQRNAVFEGLYESARRASSMIRGQVKS